MKRKAEGEREQRAGTWNPTVKTRKLDLPGQARGFHHQSTLVLTVSKHPEAAVKHFFHDAMARRAAAARAAAAETDREARDRQRPTARFTGPGQMARAMRELMEDTRRQQGRLIHGHSVSAEPERLGTDAPRSLKLSPEQQAASVIKLYYAGARVIRSRSCDASGRRPETNPAGTTASNQNRSRSTIPAMWK